MRKLSFVLALAVLGGAVAVSAESFTVTMKSGNTFECRYRPRQASWDDAKVVLLTELGNSITLRKDEIASVAAESENRGFGRVIDNTTLELGFVANDAEDPAAGGAADPMKALADALMNRQQDAPVYDQRQFVEPGQAGGGIPVSWTQPTGGMVPSGGPVFVNPGGGGPRGSRGPQGPTDEGSSFSRRGVIPAAFLENPAERWPGLVPG